MKTPTIAAIRNARNEAPPIAASTLGMMMNTLDAGVTADSVIMMLPRRVSDRDSSCLYWPAVGAAVWVMRTPFERGSARSSADRRRTLNGGRFAVQYPDCPVTELSAVARGPPLHAS